jgi:hypothetical protein
LLFFLALYLTKTKEHLEKKYMPFSFKIENLEYENEMVFGCEKK